MTIVCGTDFTEAAGRAMQVAEALSQKRGEPLLLVHAIHDASPGSASDGRHRLPPSAVEHMGHAMAAMRERGVVVSEQVELGDPGEVLCSAAERTKASLIVIGKAERASATSWRSNTTERTIRKSSVPVLVVRDVAPFREWLGGGRPLHVTVATDLCVTSQPAIEWAGALRRVGRAAFVLAHVFWPPDAHLRLGFRGSVDCERIQPSVRDVLERELGLQAQALGGTDEVRLRYDQSFGRAAEPVVAIARAEHADLVVVGSHQWGGIERLWHGSVSESIVRQLPMSVACVPAAFGPSQANVAPIRTIVAATDLSPNGNLAVCHAYSIAASGARVVLINVFKMNSWGATDRRGSSDACRLAERLCELIPESAHARGVESEILVVPGSDEATTICRAAERLGAELVVLGSEGRAGLSRPLFGSVREDVILRSRVPVLVVPPARVLSSRTVAKVKEPGFVTA